MPDGWEWDPTLFRGSAVHYRRGRLPYAPGLAETAATVLGLDGRGRLLDVGCGPGTVLLALARYFTEAVGLDPDEDMLAEAERQAERRGVGNARWVTGRAEDLPAGLGTFRIVLFAQSFHWTDRDRVAATVRGMLEPGGAFVHISDVDIGDVHISDAHISDAKDAPTATASLPWPASPYAEMGELVREYLGPVRRAGQGRLVDGTPGREDLVLERAGFEDFEQHVVPAGQLVERTADDLVAWAFSRSDSAPHLYGGRLAEFERDLRALLRKASPDGRFAERLPATQIMIWRPPRDEG
ncbi:SAM-dependent methyltransferase [Streptomyces sp. SAI-208]|uniref:class I SAM-dependent methyltransferase n=1 Tax=Streptomyces sp. SAI-208 TaxID=2940550 RepID=UPI002475EA8C|nr:class I SAM-dependent methyltransferase [Streptomyces sp. SAI-208]MDH6606717.1 SAM-dependent methyltransferase [Streptomyces sp. SAI-208]